MSGLPDLIPGIKEVHFRYFDQIEVSGHPKLVPWIKETDKEGTLGEGVSTFRHFHWQLFWNSHLVLWLIYLFTCSTVCSVHCDGPYVTFSYIYTCKIWCQTGANFIWEASHFREWSFLYKISHYSACFCEWIYVWKCHVWSIAVHST